ncbi:MAG: hypothetical protein V1689_14220 [Pseudomonadota bacterium]
MAHFDKTIPPGGEGKITLKVNTKGYQGKVTKSAKVYHNDPRSEVLVLKVTANVKVPIYLSSRYVSFQGWADQSATRVIEIRAELDKPLKLTPIEFNLADKLTYTIEEIQEGKRFRITFKTIPGDHPTLSGFLKLKTNYPEKPEITVRIRVLATKKG